MSEDFEKQKAEKREHPVVKSIGWLITAVCMVWVGWMARSVMPESIVEDDGAAAAMAAAVVPVVEVVEVRELSLSAPLEYIGRVEPMQDVSLRAQIDGYIHEVHFEEGALVKAGDLLYSIDPERYEARVAVRKAEIGQAVAALDRADRYLKRLEQSDARAIVQRDLDTARSDVDQARAAIKQAEANLVLAEYDLKHTKIIAPIGGKIGRTSVYKGDYVAPSLGTLARIVQMDPIRVSFPVTDRDFLKLRENNGTRPLEERLRIRLRLPTGTIPEVEGKHDFEDNVMSADTATILARARFDNPQGLLVPDGYVTVLADLADAPPMPTITQDALITQTDGDYVYVVDGEGIANLRRVKSGAVLDGMVPVTEGLKAGERVVIKGMQKVVQGTPVEVATVQKGAESK